MKKIYLRDYYPFYTTDTIVEVPDEVADLLHEYKLNEAAYILRTYRHKAYFSLDYDANVERDALVIVLHLRIFWNGKKKMPGCIRHLPLCRRNSGIGFMRTIFLA